MFPIGTLKCVGKSDVSRSTPSFSPINELATPLGDQNNEGSCPTILNDMMRPMKSAGIHRAAAKALGQGRTPSRGAAPRLPLVDAKTASSGAPAARSQKERLEGSRSDCTLDQVRTQESLSSLLEACAEPQRAAIACFQNFRMNEISGDHSAALSASETASEESPPKSPLLGKRKHCGPRNTANHYSR